MPICEECGDLYKQADFDTFDDEDAAQVSKLYRAIAEDQPKLDLMQMVFDMFGARCDLSPPHNELRLVEKIRSKGRVENA